MIKSNDNPTTTLYIALIDKVTKTVYVKTKTVKSIETLQRIRDSKPDDFLKPLKIRAMSHDEAKIKACKFYELNSEDFKIDTGRHHNLIEIEEFDF